MPTKQHKSPLLSKIKPKAETPPVNAKKKAQKPLIPLGKRLMKSASKHQGTRKEELPRLKAGCNQPCTLEHQFKPKCKAIPDEPHEPSPSRDIRKDPTVIEIRLNDSLTNLFFYDRTFKCIYDRPKRRPVIMTRGTQTLYRESSMQTLPYLPEVSNDKEALKTLELFRLPEILKGDGPPGVREVEILERARKRWAFEKAIRDRYECAMKTARTAAERKKLIPKHKSIMEAFEWERWLQREEQITSCQMLRLQLVLRILEKREREMHRNSALRLKMKCEEIINKRDHQLKKNEIAFGRDMRRLKSKYSAKPRNWRKEKISDDLGDPSSEYYGPQMRYGVNPNRRHFQISRKAFEMRMEDLNKRAVNMKNLECPFAKLKEWSKPKVQEQDVEPNFCTETNLQKLYECLKNLREQSKKQKVVPKCLIEKQRKSIAIEEKEEEKSELEELEIENEEENIEMEEEIERAPSRHSRSSLLEMNSQRRNQRFRVDQMLEERRQEELENMIAEYEGSTIGWLMRFLSEEMERLQEQRKLHFVSMLAQKERWRREAIEGGLRQKENEVRRIYEEIFHENNVADGEVCEQYLDNIFGNDTKEQADFEATTNVTKLAKLIDQDLQRWLDSFQAIQNPLNYDNLRCLLRDLVFPDECAAELVERYETQSIVDYIINDVIFERFYELVEPYDISTTLASDFIDRLIDNDLLLFSSDESSGCECIGYCRCKAPRREAKAILRKIIRYSVPGRRWRTPSELMAAEGASAIIENVQSLIESDDRECHALIQNIPSEPDIFNAATYSVPDNEGAESSTDNSYTDNFKVISYRKMKHVHDDSSPPASLTTKQEIYQKLFTEEGIKSSKSKLFNEIQKGKLPPSTSQLKMLTGLPSQLLISTPSKLLSAAPSRITLSAAPSRTISAAPSFRNIALHEGKSFIDIKTTKKSGGASDRSLRSVEPKSQISFHFSESRSASSSEQSSEKKSSSSIDLRNMGSFGAYLLEPSVSTTAKQYVMVMHEGEVERILNNDDSCMCQTEIDYKNYIQKLYEKGLIQIIPKSKPAVESETEQSIKDIDIDEMVFKYETDGYEECEIEQLAERAQEEDLMGDEEEEYKYIDEMDEAQTDMIPTDAPTDTYSTYVQLQDELVEGTIDVTGLDTQMMENTELYNLDYNWEGDYDDYVAMEMTPLEYSAFDEHKEQSAPTDTRQPSEAPDDTEHPVDAPVDEQQPIEAQDDTQQPTETQDAAQQSTVVEDDTQQPAEMPAEDNAEQSGAAEGVQEQPAEAQDDAQPAAGGADDIQQPAE